MSKNSIKIEIYLEISKYVLGTGRDNNWKMADCFHSSLHVEKQFRKGRMSTAIKTNILSVMTKLNPV
jgi:hypothetical protein